MTELKPWRWAEARPVAQAVGRQNSKGCQYRRLLCLVLCSSLAAPHAYIKKTKWKIPLSSDDTERCTLDAGRAVLYMAVQPPPQSGRVCGQGLWHITALLKTTVSICSCCIHCSSRSHRSSSGCK